MRSRSKRSSRCVGRCRGHLTSRRASRVKIVLYERANKKGAEDCFQQEKKVPRDAPPLTWRWKMRYEGRRHIGSDALFLFSFFFFFSLPCRRAANRRVDRSGIVASHPCLLAVCLGLFCCLIATETNPSRLRLVASLATFYYPSYYYFRYLHLFTLL